MIDLRSDTLTRPTEAMLDAMRMASMGDDSRDGDATVQKLERMAQYDSLTGLANRSLFNDRLRIAVARSHRNRCALALMFIDLDGFKAVNDSLGHEAGDELLRDLNRHGFDLERILEVRPAAIHAIQIVPSPFSSQFHIRLSPRP